MPGDGTVGSRVQGTGGNLLVRNYIAPSTIWICQLLYDHVQLSKFTPYT